MCGMEEVRSAVEQLHAAGLHSSVVELLSVAPCSHLDIQLLLAESLLKLREFRRAEAVYKDLLAGGGEGQESEIKWQLAQCYLGLGQSNPAVNVLQSIPARQRSARVSLALGRLFHLLGHERHAATAYREVVRQQPLALDALRALVQLGRPLRELEEAAGEAGQVPGWLPAWLQAQTGLYSKDWAGAGRELGGLERELRGPALVVDRGLALHWAGEESQAISELQRAAGQAPHCMRGMDSLAALLAGAGRTRELEQLAIRLMAVSEDQPQSWVALGYFCHLSKKSPRAVYFAHKACLLDSRNVEALLLKGRVLLDLKKLTDALNHYREAVGLAGHRHEAHRGLVDCYLGLNRHREAVTAATTACKQLNNSPRALTLYATVLLKEPLSVARAKSLLVKASASGHLPAVYLLAELLETEGATQKAVELLSSHLQHSSTTTLHQKLADLLCRGPGQEDRAVDHFTRALALDPKNEAALAGLQRMEKESDGMEGGYSGDLQDMEEGGGGSPIGQGEDSAAEDVWSDGDINHPP